MPRRNEVEAGFVKYVYMLQSEPFPDRHYVGCTGNLGSGRAFAKRHF